MSIEFDIACLRAPCEPDDRMSVVQLISRARMAADQIEELLAKLADAEFKLTPKPVPKWAYNVGQGVYLESPKGDAVFHVFIDGELMPESKKHFDRIAEEMQKRAEQRDRLVKALRGLLGHVNEDEWPNEVEQARGLVEEFGGIDDGE